MFALIDRPNRTIHLYQVEKKSGQRGTKVNVTLLDSVSTPTTIHHIVKRKLFTNDKDRRTYYALSEGAPDRGVAPSVLKYRLTSTNKLKFVDQAPLSNENIEVDLSNIQKIDMPALQLLISTKKSCEKENKTFEIKNINENIYKAFQLSGCDTALGV